MKKYFLGADVGSSKTHVLIADETGRTLGLGESGPGNHETVGYSGLAEALKAAAGQAFLSAALSKDQISGAGFGVSGYDWPSEKAPTLQAIASLGLQAPIEVVNDAIVGLLAGSLEGWGIALVSGTGCNCWGWDRERQREGRVTGDGMSMGEAAGASDLVEKALQAVAYEWTRRGPPTKLTAAFLKHTCCNDLTEMLDSLVTGQKSLGAPAAPMVFQVAAAGDPVANEVICWAGCELAELAKCVIRQLEFEKLAFDVVLVGSMFDGGPLLIEPLRQAIHAYAPGARLVRLTAPPVSGAVLLAMEAAGIRPSTAVRRRLIKGLKSGRV
jgi:N-acetylglucosamine kinase-like BadF-type ATPase